LFFRKQIESDEYKRCMAALVDQQRELSKLRGEFEALEAKLLSLRGRFYQHVAAEEAAVEDEKPEAKGIKTLNPFGL